MSRVNTALAALLLGSLWAPVHADILLMDSVSTNPANDARGLLRPDKGLDMNSVKQRFGTATEEINWVGDPPITRWVYPDFTVYFESNQVIHSVVHQTME